MCVGGEGATEQRAWADPEWRPERVCTREREQKPGMLEELESEERKSGACRVCRVDRDV